MPATASAIALETFTTFGDLLRYLRRRAGLTQRELATAVGYSDGQISRLEQNLRLPDLPTIPARFAAALDIENDPGLMARLMELAVAIRREDAPASGSPPFKGLHYFDEADADMFFGREALIARLLARLTAPPSERNSPRFLAIVGASGSGKSSLVRAGLIPGLRWGQSSSNWLMHTLTPTARPLQALAACLSRETDSLSAMAALIDELARDSRSLHLFLSRRPAVRAKGQPAEHGVLPAAGIAPVAIRHVLVVDQFEEIFTQCRDEVERRAFIDNLMTAAIECDGAGYILIALRADFYDQCAPYVALRDAIASRQEYIGPMSAVELRRAIEEPAKRGSWEMEPGLVDALLEAVADEPGVLPLLSHALLETWQRRRGRTLTLSGYMASGGVRGAIAETAEAVFQDQLSPEQQAIARSIFLRLTAVGESDAFADTRRRATFDQLVSKPDDAANVRAVLTLLADARLITTDDNLVEVAHEALIREWPTLHAWLEDNRAGLRLHRHLTDAAAEWDRRGRDSAELYRGARLAQAQEWAAWAPQAALLNTLEREFLQASRDASERAEADREAQRQREVETAHKLAAAEKTRAEEQARSADRLRARNRVITAIGAVGLALAVLAAVFGVQSDQNARQAGANLSVAQANLARAESLRLAAESNTILSENGDVQTAALLSLRALDNAYTPAADAALVRALTRLPNRQQFVGHTAWVYAVAVSPDGKYVLTGSLDNTARLWEAASGREIRSFTGHNAGVVAVAFSPDGQYVLTGSNDQTARLWETATGREIRSFTGHTAGLTRVAFSPDGRYVLTGSGDNTARLWETATGQALRTFSGHSSLVSAVAFSPDGQYVLTGSLDQTARIWDLATGREVRQFTGHTGGVNAVAYSPDGRYVLTGSNDTTARLWEASTGQEVRAFTGHDSYVYAVAFSPDGKYVLTSSADKTARLWDALTGQQLRTFIGHTSSVRDATFSPDGHEILTAGDDSIARSWDAGTGPSLRLFAGGVGGLAGVAFSPDGQYILTAQGNTAWLWETATGQMVRVYSGHTKDVTSLAFSPDGQYVLTGSYDHTVRLWGAQTGQPLRVFTGFPVGVVSVAFSPDSRLVAATGPGGLAGSFLASGTTYLWDAATGQQIASFEIGPSKEAADPLSVLAFSPDGKNLLIRGFDTAVSLVDIRTGRELRTFAGHTTYVRSGAFSPDGRSVLTGSEDKTARLWDTQTGREIRQFTDQTSTILSVAFSPDGKYVLSGHDDSTARLWDAQTGQPLRQLIGHTAGVTSVAFSRDGKYVLTGSRDGTVRLWDTDYHDTIRFACSLLWRDLTNDEAVHYSISVSLPTCPP